MKYLKLYFAKHPVLAAISAYVFFFFASLPFNAKIWPHYITTPTRPFDMNIYMNIAETGYTIPTFGAFFPVWPLILRCLLRVTGPTYFVQCANFLCVAMFFVSIRLIWELCSKITNPSMATWAAVLYTLNPNSIFRVIAYPESFFGMFVLIFLLSTLRYLKSPNAQNLCLVAISCACFSSARPIIPQLWASGFATIVVLLFLNRHSNLIASRWKPMISWFIAVVVSCAVTYIPVGLFFLKRFDNFWQPFQAHKYWNRKFGLYWSVITDPKSVGGSDNVLTWDFQGFYLPAILLAVFLYWIYQNQRRDMISPSNTPDRHILSSATASMPQTVSLPGMSFENQFITLLCLFIATAHSVLQFLTYPIFMSLARHIFTTPFFYISSTSVLFLVVNPLWQRRILSFYAFGSIVYLMHYWTRFGNSAWMG